MPENQNIEWKQSWRDEYLKWVCAFANTDGSVLEIERMFAACAEHGCPDPVFRHEPIGLMTTLPFMVEPTASPQDTSVKTSVKTSARIIELLKEDPTLTLAEIARIIGKSKRAVEMASSKLVKEKKLRYVGPQKGGHWEILEDCDE